MDRRGLILGLGLIAAFSGTMRAARSAEGKRVALVVGNGAYSNVPELPNPPNDASDLAAALGRLGFAVTLLTNASFEEMRRASGGGVSALAIGAGARPALARGDETQVGEAKIGHRPRAHADIHGKLRPHQHDRRPAG